MAEAETGQRISQGDMAKAAPFISAIAFLVALVFSTRGDAFSIGLWIMFSLVAVIMLPVGFPHTWRYSLWLGALYVIFSLGTVVTYYLVTLTFFSLLVIPVILAVGILVTWTLFERVRMDRFMQYRLFKGTGVRVAQSPIGLWFIGLVVFDVFSIVSGLGMGRWILSETIIGQPLMYILSEIVLVLLACYLLYYPEAAFPWDTARLTFAKALNFDREKVQEVASSLSPANLLKKKTSYVVCPSCKSPLSRTKLRCPSCGAISEAGWCSKHESFLSPCPSCSKLTFRGKKECRSCGAKIGHDLACEKCGNRAPLKEWNKASGPKKKD